MTHEQIQKEVKHFKSTGKLTSHPYLYCTVTGEKVMSFGQMLQKKIQKYNGLENLLNTFVSRKAKSLSKPPKITKVKRQKKIKIEKIDEQTYDIPTFRNEPPKVILLSENSEHTKSACLRPDIFLDSGRKCDYCFMNGYCQAPNKKFSKKF